MISSFFCGEILFVVFFLDCTLPCSQLVQLQGRMCSILQSSISYQLGAFESQLRISLSVEIAGLESGDCEARKWKFQNGREIASWRVKIDALVFEDCNPEEYDWNAENRDCNARAEITSNFYRHLEFQPLLNMSGTIHLPGCESSGDCALCRVNWISHS